MNTAKRRKVVFLDIDGTLIGGEQGLVREDREAMEEASRKGHFLFLNTGRSFANIPRDLIDLSFLKGVVAGGGAHILLVGSSETSDEDIAGKSFKTIYRQFVSGEMLEKIFAWYGQRTKCCILEGERNCYYINQTDWFFTSNTRVQVNSLEDFRNKSQGDFITKLSFDDFVSEEEKTLLETDFKLNWFRNYVEGIIKGENKAKAMEIVMRHLALGREDSIAIGDGVNDIDMIRYAGLGIAMDNACAELKAAAGAVTGACGKGGVAEALRKYVL